MKTDEFSDVLKCHGDTAFRMACHLTGGNEQLARDLVQDAFIKIWKNWEWQRPQSFKAWMYRILHNLYIDHLRRKTREASDSYDVPTPTDEGTLRDLLPSKGLLPQEILEKEELKKNLHQALERLPEDFRIPIILCDMEGLSYEEIAEIVACPVGTVRSRIHRGRRELRAALVQWAPIAVAVATALGAWFLCRAQKQMSSKAHIEMVRDVKPLPPLAHLKGESREQHKS
jgi:RNA polymerase sigma factor (sigma-70 family)